MDARSYAFVTFRDPSDAMRFVEVRRFGCVCVCVKGGGALLAPQWAAGSKGTQPLPQQQQHTDVVIPHHNTHPSKQQQRDHAVRGRRVDVKAAMAKHLGGNTRLTRKLFVGGTKGLRHDEFAAHFAAFGAVEDAVLVHRDGVSRGFGFVTFGDETSVERCLLGERLEWRKRGVGRGEVSGIGLMLEASAVANGPDQKPFPSTNQNTHTM